MRAPDYKALLAELEALCNSRRLSLDERETVAAAWRAIKRVQDTHETVRLAVAAAKAKGEP